MKTSFLSLILIAVFLSISTSSFTKTVECINSSEQFQTKDNGFNLSTKNKASSISSSNTSINKQATNSKIPTKATKTASSNN